MISAQQVAQWESEASAMRARVATAENKAEHYRQEAGRLRAALEICAADFSSAPGTVTSVSQEIASEFQRRMQVAADALDYKSSDGPSKEG